MHIPFVILSGQDVVGGGGGGATGPLPHFLCVLLRRHVFSPLHSSISTRRAMYALVSYTSIIALWETRDVNFRE